MSGPALYPSCVNDRKAYYPFKHGRVKGGRTDEWLRMGQTALSSAQL